jgi:PPK2 family polyphosphate:nucleotide phosphotransferase
MADRPILFTPPKSPYLVPFNGRWKVDKADTAPPKDRDGKKAKKKNKKALAEEVAKLAELQRRLYAADRHSVLFVFQAMDAAGKDGTIRAVLSGVNPAGVQVSSFKKPSDEELDHDFLWRTTRALPERGRIGIFNRSHYEEVLIVRVHPGILTGQRLPKVGKSVWRERFESIRNYEQHLARNGTAVVKFFLNVSKDEQRDRLVARIDDETKNWKFEAGDLVSRANWPKYMAAYQSAINATSRPWAPWYAIPADDKPFMRATVASIMRRTLEGLKPKYPSLDEAQTAALAGHRETLLSE